jgi:hypothetical protein
MNLRKSFVGKEQDGALQVNEMGDKGSDPLRIDLLLIAHRIVVLLQGQFSANLPFT